jgi:hypothetical protein
MVYVGVPPRQTLEAMWLDYIIKLNDREISKRQASGFTYWAQLGVISVIFYRLLEKLPILITNIIPINQIFVIIINLLLTLFAGFIVINMLFPSQSERRLLSTMSKKTGRYSGIILCVMCLTMFLDNFFIAYNSKHYFYYATGSIWAFQLFEFAMIEKQKVPQLESGYSASKRFEQGRSLGVLFVFIIFLICFIYQLKDIEESVITNINIIQTAFEIVTLYVLLFWLLLNFTSNLKRNWLLNLEQRILVERLEADEIKRIFITEYLGQKTFDWLTTIQTEINQKYEKLKIAQEMALSEIEEIATIDKELKYEISGRINETRSKMQKDFSEYTDYAANKIAQVKLFISNGTLTEETEVISEMVQKWESQIEDVRESIIQVYGKCKEIQPDRLICKKQ